MSIQAKNVNHPGYQEPLNEQKYTLIRDAILGVVPTEGGITFQELETEVTAHLKRTKAPMELFPKPGSVRWYCKVVQLDLEARDLIERVPGKVPLQIRKR